MKMFIDFHTLTPPYANSQDAQLSKRKRDLAANDFPKRLFSFSQIQLSRFANFNFAFFRFFEFDFSRNRPLATSPSAPSPTPPRSVKRTQLRTLNLHARSDANPYGTTRRQLTGGRE